VIVKDPQTEKPYYEACSVSDLSQQMNILPISETKDELEAIERISPQIMDVQPTLDRPPWKLVVLPLQPTGNPTLSKCFIAFSFSHALGDGISGLAFHKSFLAGLQDPTAAQYHKPAKGSMPEPFDTRKNLPISLGYLLAPALGQYLPKFVSKALGLRPAVSTITPTTWLGNRTVFLDAEHRSGVRVFKLEGAVVDKLVQKCREHDTKLTSLLHQVIIHALSVALPDDSKSDSFASQTAINMRHHVKVSNDTMGLYVTGYFDVHSRTTDTTKIWTSAKAMNTKLHACSNTLQDQSIGLLRFLLSIRSWTAGHMGGSRDASYELSNLLAFDPGVHHEGSAWTLGNMAFAQPANVTGAPLAFNVVARRSQNLVCTVTWQVGALGVEKGEDEGEFVDRVVEGVLKNVRQLLS
jgi:hypothetical protein